MDVMERIAGLPKRPHPANTSGPTEYYLKMIEYREAQLALAREWIAKDGCEDDCMVYRAIPHPCTCGRDALLKALEVPK